MFKTSGKATPTQGLALGLALTAATFAAACGDSRSSALPTAPSASVDGSAQSVEVSDGSAESGVTGGPKGNNGNGNGNNGGGNGNGNGGGNNGGGNNGGGNGGNQPTVPGTPTGPGNTSPTIISAKTVQIEGVISSRAAATMTVNAQMVTVPATAVIRHGNRQYDFSDLRVGDRVHVKARRITTAGSSSSAATTTIEATEVKLQNPVGNPNDPDDDDGDDDEEPVTQLVSAAALDATASESGPDIGAFQLTRSGDTTAALTVTIALTGTATAGSDYAPMPLTVTFGAGQATATVVVVPLPDTTAEGSETVILTVVDGTGYDAGSPAAATVTIAG